MHPTTVAIRIPLALAGLFLDVATCAAQTPVAAADTMASRALACAACHGEKGQGTDDVYFPRLAGKPAGYLVNQLQAFKTGRRHYPPMNYLIEYLPEAYLREFADYYAAQRPPLPVSSIAIVSDAILAHGKALVTKGDAKRDIPACQGCHGVGFTGMEPGIPGLLGLRATYISAQLGAWRYGTRTAIAPDCMQIVASHLTEDDVKAVAAWLSSQPAPDNAVPAPKGSYALPLACGSEPK
jgi:cytochrome c553